MHNQILDFLNNKSNYYLNEQNSISFNKGQELEPQDFIFYHIKNISDNYISPIKNILNSINIDGIYFIYLIVGDTNGISFYFGISKDLYFNGALPLEINDIGKYILEPNIKQTFKYADIERLDALPKRILHDNIKNMKYCNVLEGISQPDNSIIQNIADIMVEDEFAFMVICKVLNSNQIDEVETNINNIYSEIRSFAERDINSCICELKGTDISITDGNSQIKNTNNSKLNGNLNGKENGTSKTTQLSVTKPNAENTTSQGKENSESTNNTVSTIELNTQGNSEYSGEHKFNTKSNIESEAKSKSVTTKVISKQIQEWIKYIDDILIPRLNCGKSSKMFISSTFLFSNKIPTIFKLGSTIKSLVLSDFKIPLKIINITDKSKELFYKQFQLPSGIINSENKIRAILSQYINKDNELYLGTLMSSDELNSLIGLPNKEFLNLNSNINTNLELTDKIYLGKALYNGYKLNQNIYLNQRILNQNIFISDTYIKSNILNKLLTDTNLNFILITPFKSDYNFNVDIKIFDLNDSTEFKINIFEFYKNETITSRIDIIKSLFKNIFNVQDSILIIVETAIYECYKDYGWNIKTTKNEKFNSPFDKINNCFPTISDLLKKLEKVNIKTYNETIQLEFYNFKANLQFLLSGYKESIFNSNRSLDFSELIETNIVVELDALKNQAEKSFITQLILINLEQAIKLKAEFELNHIAVVDKIDKLFNNKSIFNNILKNNNQCFVVTNDVIPNEIIKNCGTKINVDQNKIILSTQDFIDDIQIDII